LAGDGTRNANKFTKILVFRSGEGNGIVTQNPHLDQHQHQNSIISRRSSVAHAYHVWLTSVNAFVSYPAHRQTDRQTE